MECWTNQPCVLIYTGNFLPKDKSMVGKEGACYQRHGCFCLQTEGYQDSINNPSFPQAGVLKPGEVYDHRIIFKFVAQGVIGSQGQFFLLFFTTNIQTYIFCQITFFTLMQQYILGKKNTKALLLKSFDSIINSKYLAV